MGYSIPRIVKTMQVGNWETVNVSELYMKGDDVLVYPNPTSDNLNFKSNNPATAISGIELIDITGRTVFTKSNISNSNVEINTTELNSGIYLGKITLENGQEVVKKFSVE